jgi:very-short-patch-repair endonuclease
MRRLGGWRWRRQHIVAGYVVDFYCPALRLAVGVDGDVHATQHVQDTLRDQDLSALGCVVLRVLNEEVLVSGEAVANRIVRLCRRIAESRTPPPEIGGRRGGGPRGYTGPG